MLKQIRGSQHGLGKGSVLLPILFNIIMNDVCNKIKNESNLLESFYLCR
jgi:hypothetical protein